MKVELMHITKTFYGAKALDDVQLTINSGEINCLVGENGAGKSTIIKILAGYHTPDCGDIIIDGKKVTFHTPRDSQKCKISVIHQELMLVPEITVAENIFLGDYPRTKLGTVSRKQMNMRAAELLKSLGSTIDPTRITATLSTGEQQIVEIAKALSKDVELLILDEPTASLSVVDSDRLLEIVRELKAKGIAILYVSHKLEEVFSIADKITVFRDGKFIGCENAADMTKDQVVKMMVGYGVSNDKVRHRVNKLGNVALEVKHLTSRKRFKDISFKLHRGEVLGIAGLVGAGRSEILRAIYGLDKFDSGEIIVNGERKKFCHPFDAIRSGLSLVPEDRKLQGLVMEQSVKNNIVLGIMDRIHKLGFVRTKAVDKIANDFREKLSIKTKSIDVPVKSLSGGNQQKVVIARSLAMTPDILILDEPTRGVDVGARKEIHRLIDAAVNQNLAVLIVSSDILELLDLSDRVLVLKDGNIVGHFTSDEISKEEVISLATA